MSDPAARTILVIDDDEALRTLLRDVLEESGYAVVEAANADEALAAARSSGRVLDLVISDVAIPGASGSQIAPAIPALHPRAGLLYMSGFIAGTLGQEAARADGARFLDKPFAVATLLREVKQLIGERRPAAKG